MKLVVLVKEVPDTYGERKLDLETGLTDREGAERVLDEVNERAIEAAVTHKESHPDTEVVLLGMAPESAVAALRKGLAMGADSAVHVVAGELVGADLTLTSEVLAAAIDRIGCDLVVAGNVSTDGGAGVLPAMVAERLGMPHATFLSEWELTDETVAGRRVSDAGSMTVSAPLPAVVSLTEAFPEPRMPGFKGIMQAKKKPFETWSLEELGVSAAPDVPRSIMIAVDERPQRSAGITIEDQGDAGRQLAAFLVEKRLTGATS